MPLMNSELYDALLEAGTSEEKARKAAESVAEYETFFVYLESAFLRMKWGIGMLIVAVLLFIAGTVWIR
jgi:hypothetical protein